MLTFSCEILSLMLWSCCGLIEDDEVELADPRSWDTLRLDRPPELLWSALILDCRLDWIVIQDF